MSFDIGSILQVLFGSGLNHINTLLLIVIAWFVNRQIKSIDKQTETVNNMLLSHERRITVIESKTGISTKDNGRDYSSIFP